MFASKRSMTVQRGSAAWTRVGGIAPLLTREEVADHHRLAWREEVVDEVCAGAR